MTTAYPNAKILVFSKAPEPGRVKTRLMPDYSAEQAASIHSNLVHHTLTTLSQAKLCPIELWCAPDCDSAFFKACKKDYPLELKQQQGNDLGERMHHAFQSALQIAEQVIIVGTDCPTLTKSDIETALGVLSQPIDAAIAPADDGGYVLIGLTRNSHQLFTGINWGKNTVMQETLDRINRLNYSFQRLNQHSDIDYAQDLLNLPTALQKIIIKIH